jgi:thymidylate kinase
MHYHHKKRGLFIVFEGVNGCSKTSTINELMKYAIKYNKVKVFKFPDRQGECGRYIDDYLKGKLEIQSTYDKLSLFSENRLQYLNEMLTLLEEGTTIFCDRYIYSAIVYQLPIDKPCSDIHVYSMACTVGYFDKFMIQPDMVFLLNGNFLHMRGDLEKERYYYEKEIQDTIFTYFTRVLYISNSLHFIIEPIIGDINGTACSIMDIIDTHFERLSYSPIHFLYNYYDMVEKNNKNIR